MQHVASDDDQGRAAWWNRPAVASLARPAWPHRLDFGRHRTVGPCASAKCEALLREARW